MKACYIHVPFCNAICAYCDFVRCNYQKELANKWLLRVESDILNKMPNILESLYIGGGTPTALNDEQFEKLLALLHPYTGNVKEYTIEANPDSLSEQKVKLLKKYHVNRISLGIQTFQKELQNIILRKHTISEIRTLINLIHDYGIENISIDLMYGLPSQTIDMWKEDLKTVISLPIQHISLYALTIEEHSQFGRDHVGNINPQIEADMFEYAISYLTKQNYKHYEISNFALKGYESQHNQVYWKYEDFLGIGSGASGKENHCRYDNTRNLHTYICDGAMPDIIQLSKEDEMFETIMMGLRMEKGILMTDFYQTFQVDLLTKYEKAIHKNVNCGYLILDKDTIKTTYKGMLVLNNILIDFL